MFLGIGFIMSIGMILLLGFLIGALLNKVKIPGLVGMIILGLVLGPYCLAWIDPSVLNISGELRQIALIIILTRSGLNLDIKKLKEIGRPAILMCFIPATFEIVGVALASYFLLDLSIFESILLGTVLGAVSPAVVTPRMIKLIEKNKSEHSVPEIILAGSSADDIYTIILFYVFLGLVKNNTFDYVSILNIPGSIILGILLGIGVGFLLSYIFKKIKLNTTIEILIMLSASFLMIGIENIMKEYTPVQISALLGIMVVGMIILFKNKDEAKQISNGYNSIWKFFEIILFVLVGAKLNFSTMGAEAGMAVLVLLIGLAFRTCGVLCCLIKTNLNWKERIFAIISYLPKATVQASIGGIALDQGLACGNIVLMVSVLSILITAPIGALLIDNLGDYLLYGKSIKEPIEDQPEEQKQLVTQKA